MLKKSAVVILALGVSLLSHTAFADMATAKADQELCNLSDARQIYWQALGETVTLRTQVTQDGPYLPSAKLEIEFSDGTILDLGGGTKYYDDYMADNAPTCAHILAKATNMTVASLNNDPSLMMPELYEMEFFVEYRSMSDLRTDLIFAANCNKDDEIHETAYDCEKAQYVAERIAENDQNLPKHVFDRLVNENAPIIMVTGSTYFSSIMVYDRRKNSLHELYYDGC